MTQESDTQNDAPPSSAEHPTAEANSTSSNMVFGPPPFDPASQQMALPLRLLAGVIAAIVSIGVIWGVLFFAEYARSDKGFVSNGYRVTLTVMTPKARTYLNGLQIEPSNDAGTNFFFPINDKLSHVIRIEKKGYLSTSFLIPLPDDREQNFKKSFMKKITLEPDTKLATALEELKKAPALLKKRDYDAALLLCRAVLEIDPDHEEALKLEKKISPLIEAKKP